jgi:KDO2-lipid IV(A) lauroyltransferase
MFSKTLIAQKFSLNLSKFLQMKLNIFLFNFLPFAFSRWYITILGKLYYFIKRQEKELIRQTITYVFRRRRKLNTILRNAKEVCPLAPQDFDKKEELIQQTINYVFREKIDPRTLNRKIKEAFQGIFDHYHEKLFVAYSRYNAVFRLLKKRIRFVGEEKLQEALRAGKGVILVTGHFGAVEFLPGTLAVNGFPTTVICRFQTSRLRATLTQRAESIHLEVIDADEGNIMAAALKALKQGRILITECDEFDEWRPNPQRDIYFLNHRVLSDRSLEMLGKRSGAPVISALMKRNGGKTYTLNLTPVANGGSPVYSPVNEQCLRILETAIEAFPEQWYQWKKFGKFVNTGLEVEHDRQESGYLAPEVGVSVADQA